MTAACLKKKNRFNSSIDCKEMRFVAFFLLVIIAVLIAWTCLFSFKQGFFLLRLPPSFFAFRSLSLLSLSETAHRLHLFFSKRSVWVNLFYRSNLNQGWYRESNSWKSLENRDIVWKNSAKSGVFFFFQSYNKCLISDFFPRGQISFNVARILTTEWEVS